MKIMFLSSLFFVISIILQAQFISEVIEYTPAPGQFTNTSGWGCASAAQKIIGSNITDGGVSLGAFGGYVVFKFENPVKNNSDNPFGVDFTIFGNPLYDMDNTSLVGWAEPGIVSVMKDENMNGLPDDTWYELAGSDYFFSSTIKKYSVTYTNPNMPVAANVPWIDNQGNSGKVLANTFHKQPYYPIKDSFPSIDEVKYTLSGTMVEDDVDRRKPSMIKSYKKAFGYVDNQFVGESPYTTPDNPYTANVKENAGGDAFDISWAIDESGNYVDLDEIHFVKVHNAILSDAGWLGEMSTEIRGSVITTPNTAISGIMDMIVIRRLPDTIKENLYKLEAYVFNSGRVNKNATINWTSNSENTSIDSENRINFDKSGKVKFTATWADKPEVGTTDSTFLIYIDPNASIEKEVLSNINIYPNPASEFVFVEGFSEFSVKIFDLVGNILKIEHCNEYSRINLQDIKSGAYILQVQAKAGTKNFKLIKE